MYTGNAPGFVPVKVVWGQRLCTCSQLFEYKTPPTVPKPKHFTLKGTVHMSLIFSYKSSLKCQPHGYTLYCLVFVYICS